MSIIDDIVQLEWQAFDKVDNEGGRASCQNDFGTFNIMRKSQFLAWDTATLMSYRNDLQTAARLGRNLVQEKYARMMASTAPEEYAGFAHLLPPLNTWQQRTIERIVETQLGWREAFAREYPRLSDQARAIRTEEDTAGTTSFETYLRGELGTYSEETLAAYARMVDEYEAEERNLTCETMAHTAKLYGYDGLQAAEDKLAEHA
ncbi:MAG: hypothetical protein CGU28_15540 [Candidatus Dactylopiibacterium carminicum]|uniref:DUF4125 domain-containing protein n=1 Tax=Candidatus Dactylopiibacterium carminicum TaxID=857335 RepID=A0A272EN60_9RHOO|nr:DUF4125 family protein [Candidatus Dactylopiibacterium carminicum]KAF7597980.1 DUF4125 domain-containing protein [Candidatus Dactylopiibacterium carminicum]PAS91543.1 MAG: hypothetical protein CGU29_15885 [Candidatus Dactylopiibacterium carminicum]PAS93160.1 MAG: hypothetical protein CGU28_15540 [Candidatus Dactylopiibacterium carminicum]PAS96196.1 MAG: hypothetical protein BSR46_15775 [Candidatus Dactylopiibacterium carminicum]